MNNGKAFKTLDKSLANTGSIDSDGNIHLVEINGHFKTPELEIWLENGEMKYKSDLEKEFLFHSWVVNKEHYVSMCNEGNKKEFLRLRKSVPVPALTISIRQYSLLSPI